jgi:hypothetical protein
MSSEIIFHTEKEIEGKGKRMSSAKKFSSTIFE